ncbi:MAG TPA: prepilin-type N-terminal cleavage/methylation domain-containing protein [Xanthobacteraceae bacterium]|nr:prepilin-type N-terminal cleavage/methylation domain-containing protein [Xanthobacteraceae bacterium]
MTWLGRRDFRSLAGFTLVEALAALAIASVVVMGTSALVRTVALNFDRGTQAVGDAERLVRASARLAEDFAATRFVRAKDGSEWSAQFVGDPAQVRFLTAARGGSAQASAADEAVGLRIERAGEFTRLTQRRAAWPGPPVRIDGLALGDAVVLLEGRFDMRFAFARLSSDGGVVWSDRWSRQRALPRLVRLEVRDRRTGADLLAGAEFAVRADAPPGCAAPDASVSCLGAGARKDDRPAARSEDR